MPPSRRQGAPVVLILGLSSGFHDAAAALVSDGRVVAAVEEERLSRRKHDPSFPAKAAATCLAIVGATADDVDVVVHHEKPLGVVDRHLRSRTRHAVGALPSLLARTPEAVGDQLMAGVRTASWFTERGARRPAIAYAEHHTSHAAAAYYPSPYDEAAILTVDGVGEWATTSQGTGLRHRLTVDREVRYPDSLGLLYSAFTSYLGFRVNSGEGEVMGLAPFGEPRYVDRILDEVVTILPDGSFSVNPKYFAYVRGRSMTTRRFHRRFGGPPRPLGATPTQREADLAASLQAVTEEVLLALASAAHRETGLSSLCLGGGVALNCVANGRLMRDSEFDDVWIQPAAGDAGSALGAALWYWHAVLDAPRTASRPDGMSGSFLGPSFEHDEIVEFLRAERREHRVVEEDRLCALVAEELANGRVVGWFRGRMEFGPRALGHRSILADARSATVQHRLNAMVKERAAFRPFAPAVLADRASAWFESPLGTPYMTATTSIVAARRTEPEPSGEDSIEDRVRQVRGELPAVTHVDHSARVQVVDRDRNPDFARLLEAFDDLTGCPVLLNTSFNARDEPVVCTPADALRTFDRTGLDLLVLERCVVRTAS